MTHTTDQERAEFEKWWSSPHIWGRGHKEAQWASWQAARRAPVVPVPRFNHPAKRKLELLTGEGATITGYAFQSEGRRGSIDCHGFVYWWQDSALVVPQGWKLVPDANNMTDEQAEAVAEVARVCGGGALDIYRAAIAAAPQPPEADHIPDAGKMVAAPVQLPEPVAAESRFTTFAGDRWRWCTVEHARAFGADKGYEVRYLYTEQQVRQLLADHGIQGQST